MSQVWTHDESPKLQECPKRALELPQESPKGANMDLTRAIYNRHSSVVAGCRQKNCPDSSRDVLLALCLMHPWEPTQFPG